MPAYKTTRLDLIPIADLDDIERQADDALIDLSQAGLDLFCGNAQGLFERLTDPDRAVASFYRLAHLIEVHAVETARRQANPAI
jgi:hypothetical protein